VYLESVFPVMVDRTLVVPPGTYVAGTVTQVKRPGRVKGRGELFIRFDWMRLPNGVMRDFSGTVGGLDGASKDKLDKKEGKITGDSSKGSDAAKIAQGAQAGAMAGALGGWAGGRPGLGMGTGVGAGAAAGLVAVLLTRGPDAVLAKGTTVEMILDRDLTFTPDELNFDSAPRATTANRGSGDPVRKLN
jgi:type IV secretion system protein VirB10